MVKCYDIQPNTLYVSTKGNFKNKNNEIIEEYFSSNGFKYVIAKTLESNLSLKMFPSDNIIAATFIPIPEYMRNKRLIVYHADDNPSNNNVDNLSWQIEEEGFVPITFSDIKRDEYEVSQFGNIRTRFSHNECKPFITPEGYYLISLKCSDNDRKRRYRVNRIVAHQFVKHVNQDQECVNHIDGIRNNNYWKNLEWVTNQENMQHASLTNTMCGSENRTNATISAEEALMVCESLNKNHSNCQLVYDELKHQIPTLTRRQILLIKNGKSFSRLGKLTLEEDGCIKKTYKEKHYTESDIIDIATCLKENQGNCNATFNKLKHQYPWLDLEFIHRIKKKTSFSKITDSIFSKNDFPQYGMRDESVILICKTLIKHKNDQYPTLNTFNELKDIIPGLSKDMIRAIKSKKTFREISDAFFPKGYFTK